MTVLPYIRRAESRDIVALNALVHGSRASEGEYRAIIEGFAVTQEYLARNEVHLADLEGIVLGFYSLHVEGPADLDLMFVSDAAQGQGIGRTLFEHAKKLAQRHGHAEITIGAHPPAVAFYERMGAVRCGLSAPIAGVTWERPLLKLSTAED